MQQQKTTTVLALPFAGLQRLVVGCGDGYDAESTNSCFESGPEVRATTINLGLFRIAPVERIHDDVDATISCEDNLGFMRRLADESMNLIVTSPPYNLGKEYEEKRSQDRYIEEQVACISEAVRLLHPSGSICWQVGNHADVRWLA
jgi:hypothetical protein